jgi:hypothetical protein
VTDVYNESRVVHQPVDPALERWDLIGPGAIMIKDNTSTTVNRHPRYPEIPRVNEIRLSKRLAQYQRRTAGEVA